MKADSMPVRAAGWSLKCSLKFLKIFSAVARYSGIRSNADNLKRFMADKEFGLGSEPS